uniref:class IIb bacteriocin, lactobin A/cerein 7B family n=1 Tax=uncultured Tenacibaculum sp. TaxID=174713 RepID=UPI0026312A13|nr:class IIb bacteriocin, lactobin A/cerein 7B family [uncultured Tenacibaculum sp.]
MKNLKGFGVQELNAKELQEVEGGLIGLGIAAAGLFLASFSAGWMVGTALGEKSRREAEAQ